jgi:hypothetical protein
MHIHNHGTGGSTNTGSIEISLPDITEQHYTASESRKSSLLCLQQILLLYGLSVEVEDQ